MLNFEIQVEEKISFYNKVNNVFYVLVLIGAFLIAKDFSTVPGDKYYSAEKLEYSTLFTLFGGIAITYTLLYAFIRVTIMNYGENLRSNYYKNAILNELRNISK